MGKPRQRAVDIPGLQHQSGRCGSRASGRASKKPINKGERPAAELPVEDFINSERLLDRTDDAAHYIRNTKDQADKIDVRIFMTIFMTQSPTLANAASRTF
jgi:hypothetical protein